MATFEPMALIIPSSTDTCMLGRTRSPSKSRTLVITKPPAVDLGADCSESRDVAVATKPQTMIVWATTEAVHLAFRSARGIAQREARLCPFNDWKRHFLRLDTTLLCSGPGG